MKHLHTGGIQEWEANIFISSDRDEIEGRQVEQVLI